ncbi:MAG: NAD(P)/FAD-dependent oxidoreductase [Thermoleophilaceae bacterium]
MSGRVAVIGAGVAGLTAAYELAKRDVAVDVYERWPGLGGQAATLDVGGGVLLERYYHHLFTSDIHIADLYRDLGMPDAIEWLASSVAFFIEGRSRSFNSPLDLLRFTPLRLRSRVRMGLAVLILQRRHGDAAAFEHRTAHDWIVEAMGDEVWDKVMGPLLRGKFGDRAEDISMAWLWAKLTVRREIKGEQATGEKLGYPRNGFQPLFEALRDAIHDCGGQVRIDRPAARVDRDQDGFAVTAGAPRSYRLGHDPRRFDADGDRERYDAVVATVSNPIFERALGDELRAEVGTAYLGALHAVEYHAAQCLVLEMDRRFSPFYWTNVADRSLPFVGLIEQGNLTGIERYANRHFLYVANYLEQGDEALSLSADELLDRYQPGLKKVNAGFDHSWVLRKWLFVEPDAQPIVTPGYAGRLPAFDTGVPGLVLANTTQVYPEDRGTNYAVRLGRAAAEEVLRTPAGAG